MKTYLLDKELTVGTNYYTEADKALVILEAGTDDTALKNYLSVNGVPCLELINDFAPMYQINTNLNELLPLGDLQVVVPPDTLFAITGTATKKMRIKGYILDLAPGEALPAGYSARYSEQGKEFWSYIAKNLTYDTTVPAAGEVTCYEFTCPTGEKWTFGSRFLAEVLDDTTHKPQFNVRLHLQDKPFDNLVYTKLLLGIDTVATPYPPAETLNNKVFSLKDMTIDLLPGETLKITFVNTGASYTKAGTHAYYKTLLAGIKEYLKP